VSAVSPGVLPEKGKKPPKGGFLFIARAGKRAT